MKVHFERIRKHISIILISPIFAELRLKTFGTLAAAKGHTSLPLTLFSQSNTLNLSSPEFDVVNLHFSLTPITFCDFSPKPQNPCCQRFYTQLSEFPLLLPKCFMVQKCGISAFKRTFNHVHISLSSGNILDHISIVGLLASLFWRFHMRIIDISGIKANLPPAF